MVRSMLYSVRFVLQLDYVNAKQFCQNFTQIFGYAEKNSEKSQFRISSPIPGSRQSWKYIMNSVKSFV